MTLSRPFAPEELRRITEETEPSNRWIDELIPIAQAALDEQGIRNSGIDSALPYEVCFAAAHLLVGMDANNRLAPGALEATFKVNSYWFTPSEAVPWEAAEFPIAAIETYINGVDDV